jgi:hypothetical protein
MPASAKPAEFTGQKAGGFHRGLLAVIKIACNDKRIDLLIEAQIDDAAEGGPGRGADQISQILIAERQ